MLEKAHKFVQVLATLIIIPIVLIEFFKFKKFLLAQDFLFKQEYFDSFLENKDFDSNKFISRFNLHVLNLHILAKNFDLFLPISNLNFNFEKRCKNCKSIDFEQFEGSIVCNSCGLLIKKSDAIAWTDVSRVHAAPIYSYDRKIQFRELLFHFQGKISIDLELYKKIELYRPKSKCDFLHFLKSITKNKQHYEQVFALYSKLVGIPCFDLSFIENELLQDFEKFYTFQKQKIKKTICNQFILYQFLKNKNINISKDDVLLDNNLQIEELRPVFLALGWKYFD